MTAFDTATKVENTRISKFSRWSFWGRVSVAALLFLFLVVAFVLFQTTQPRRLTPKEQLLVGAWEWQGRPGMVLFFDDQGGLTYSQPPFKLFQFERWHIDDNDLIYFTADGKDLARQIRRVLAPQTDVYKIRFSNGTPILTMEVGTEQVLVPYTGDGIDFIKAAPR